MAGGYRGDSERKHIVLGRSRARNMADGKHTRVGLISRSGWSSRIGLTLCPSRQNSGLIRREDGEEAFTWQTGRVGSSGQEEQGVAMETNLRNPQ